MRTFRVPISRKTKGGFTLLELLIVVLLIGIFITFASVNWGVATKKGKEALLEKFSINIALIREEAISNYENKVLEFDITENKIRIGTIDVKTGFVASGDLPLSDEYRIKDVVINGQTFPEGKCYMTFQASGMVDRTVVHLEGGNEFYSMLVNPLTANVKGENGYIEEVSVRGRNNPT